MKILRPHRSASRLIAVLAGMALALGCQVTTPAGPIRTTMTAPDLEYLPPAQIRSAMWVLAAEVRHLERVLTAPSTTERDAMRSIVVSTLDRMRSAARTLDEPGRSSQRHVINQNLGRFLSQLDRAKRAADRDPPNFFPASGIVGSCALCHGPQSGSAALEKKRKAFRVSEVRDVD